MELMERSQKRIAFYPWNFTSDTLQERNLRLLCLLMMPLKTVKTESTKCVVFNNFVIVCTGDGLLKKLLDFSLR